MRQELDVSELRAAIIDIKERVTKIHKNPEFDTQMAQWLEVFQRNFILYAYLRKFCWHKKNEKSQNRSKDLLIKKILYVVYINNKTPPRKFGDLLRYTVGAEGSEYMSDVGLNKYDYTIMDMVGSDIMKIHSWNTNYNLEYGLEQSSFEYKLYLRGEPDVIGIETDEPIFVFKNGLF